MKKWIEILNVAENVDMLKHLDVPWEIIMCKLVERYMVPKVYKHGCKHGCKDGCMHGCQYVSKHCAVNIGVNGKGWYGIIGGWYGEDGRWRIG